MKRSSREASSAGQSLVELAISSTFVVLFIVGIFDLGWGVYAYNTVALAAREGARTAIISSKSNTAICDQAASTAQGLTLNCTINPSGSRTPGQSVTVTISYLWTPFTPLISSNPITISASATMLVE